MKYDKINLMLPTRGRVKSGKLPKFVQSAEATASAVGASVVYTFLVDADDNETYFYLNNIGLGDRAHILVNPDTSAPHLGRFFNKLYDATRFNDPGTLVSMVGDDMVFVTPGWDTKVLEAMNASGGRSLVYCDDAYTQHEKLCVNMFVSRALVGATGRPFMCPEYAADFIDSIWMMMGSKLGVLRYLSEVVIRHEHSGSGTPDTYDETFKRLRGQYQSAPNERAIHNYVDSLVSSVESSGFLQDAPVVPETPVPVIYVMLPGMMNNGGHKVGAQWVKMLRTHGHNAVLANTNGDQCKDFWDFVVPVCSFSEVVDEPQNILVWNWGPDLPKRSFSNARQYYFAQDCCQPHYPGNEQYMPLLRKLPLIAVGQHCKWFYEYTEGLKVLGVVNNYVDQGVFRFDPEKQRDSRCMNLCMMDHRDHWNPGFVEKATALGFTVHVARGTQEQVAEAMAASAYFVSFAPGITTPHGNIEGFGLPTAEAMASGCITLAINNGGNTEFLLDSVNGFFHTGEEEALQLLRGLARGPSELRSRIADNAYYTFRNRFNEERTYGQIKKVLDL